MKSIAEQIAYYLSNKKVATYTPDDVTGNIFIDYLPEDNDIIAIFNTSGIKSDLLNYRHLGIQVFYRGNTNPVTSFQKADEVFCFLNRKSGYFMNGGNYIVDCNSIAGGVEHIGTDENGNHEYSMNFIVDFNLK